MLMNEEEVVVDDSRLRRSRKLYKIGGGMRLEVKGAATTGGFRGLGEKGKGKKTQTSRLHFRQN